MCVVQVQKRSRWWKLNSCRSGEVVDGQGVGHVYARRRCQSARDAGQDVRADSEATRHPDLDAPLVARPAKRSSCATPQQRQRLGVHQRLHRLPLELRSKCQQCSLAKGPRSWCLQLQRKPQEPQQCPLAHLWTVRKFDQLCKTRFW